MKDDGGETGIVIEEAEIVDCEGESKPYFQQRVLLSVCKLYQHQRLDLTR